MTAAFDLVASSWIPVFLLLGFTLYLRVWAGSWFVPGPFFGLLWFGFLAGSLLAVDHRVPGLGTWALVSLIAAVQIGSMLGETGNEEETLSPPERAQLQRRTRLHAWRATLLLTLVALAGLTYFAWYSMNLFQQQVSFTSLIPMAAKWTLLRYDGFLDPWPLRLAAVWVYPPALVGGILFSLSQHLRDKAVALLSLLPVLLLTALSGGRSAFLVGLACWLGGHWSARAGRVDLCRSHVSRSEVDRNPVGRSRVLSSLTGLKSGFLLGFGALALLLLFLGVDSLRGAKEDSDVRDFSLEFRSGQVRNYMFGMPAAFAEWFDSDQHHAAQWGALTLPGPFAVLGIHARTLGTYTDSASTVGIEGTNVFTIFRGLVEDFTLGGAFLICGLWGFLGGRTYSRGSLATGSLLGLSAYYSVALFSPLYFLFGFNGPLFAWIVAWFALPRGRRKAA
jgi:hypothetical protein